MKTETAISTHNKKGFTYSLSSFGKAFINAASKSSHPVMDVGAAYGVATLPALLTGAKVIAVDIDPDHLRAIESSVTETLRPHLFTLTKRFPHFEMPAESLSAIYLSQVLPFLTGSEIELGARKIYDWLVPGGEVFIVSFTPYISHVSSFIPVYEERKSRGERWGGYIDDLSLYSNDPAIYTHLPNQIHHVDADDLRAAFEEAGFTVREVRYFGEEEGLLPDGIRMDGKERVGLVAYKPVRSEDSQNNNWENINTTEIAHVPDVLREWLCKPFVLSRALRKVCAQFTVHITDQRVKPLYADEIAALGCYETSNGYIRETYLGDENHPFVYARVTMPESTYLMYKAELDNLGNRPIGETLLYSNPTTTRSDFEIKRITQDDELLFDELVHTNFYKAVIERNARVPELWARRSVFTLHGHPLLITEVFLSDIPDYID